MLKPNKYEHSPYSRAEGKTYAKQASGFKEITPKPSQENYETSKRPAKRRAIISSKKEDPSCTK